MNWQAGDKAFAALKIAVIDDEPHMRRVIRALLNAIGVRQVIEADDGYAGLQLLEQQAPHIVILDWEMPHLSGPEFMRIVRSPGQFPFPTVPVLMLTGHGEKARVLEAMNSGINEFLLKPVSAQMLADRLKAMLHCPRPFVREQDYFGPARRMPKVSDYTQDLVML
jgi:two-component system, chemotaxis family, chemotaxis protein CheY